MGSDPASLTARGCALLVLLKNSPTAAFRGVQEGRRKAGVAENECIDWIHISIPPCVNGTLLNSFIINFMWNRCCLRSLYKVLLYSFGYLNFAERRRCIFERNYLAENKDLFLY